MVLVKHVSIPELPLAKIANQLLAVLGERAITKPFYLQKGLFNLTQACIVDGDFWVPNEIDS